MKKVILFVLFFTSIQAVKSHAQGFEDEFYVTNIKLDKEKIMLNNVYAFKYNTEPNGYTISTKEGKTIIIATSKTMDQTKQITTFSFVKLEDKKFTNSMINTPEQLFKMFADTNVITEDFQINYTQLKGILVRYDGK